MKITLIGLGCGTQATVTGGAKDALARASAVIGARRLVDSLPQALLSPACARYAAVTVEDIQAALGKCEGEVCLVMSGDSGFYSGTRRLLPILKQEHEVTVLPGISSVQALSARLGEPWQDWALYSAHGVDCDILAAVCGGKDCFFLTGGEIGIRELCRILCDAGLEELSVTVGENLTSDSERIVTGPAKLLVLMDFAPLSVALVRSAPRFERRTPGLPDEAFERVKAVPMTKQEVRAAALSKLGVTPADVCWDVGAGTGSVSVELALQGRSCWAVERNEEALELARVNRKKFGAWNLHLVAGSAPEALADFPAPDAVFIGGSGGGMEKIIQTALEKNPKARICVTAIAVESLQQAQSAFLKFGIEPELTLLSVSRNRKAGKLNLMMAQNPIFIITGAGA